jgi:TonB family protein
MDPVSKMLSDRERAQPGLWPWVVLATVLHGSLVGVTFLITPTSVPEPEPTAPPQQQDFSADAMPAPDSRATPVPTPAQPGTYDTGRGLSVGQEAGRRESGIPPDFHFTYYVERMLALIESRWYKPAVPKGTRALARFRIHSDGRMDLIELEESSGHPSFDRAALRALYAANPLPPLPPAYLNPSLTVHLAFTE